MNPGTHDLSLYRGDSYHWLFEFYQDAAQTVPTDLTGATADAEIRDKTAGAKIVVLQCTVTLPNIVEVVMDPTLYATCPAKGVWDLQLTFADGQVHTPLKGAVTVNPDVTDSVAMPAVARR